MGRPERKMIDIKVGRSPSIFGNQCWSVPNVGAYAEGTKMVPADELLGRSQKEQTTPPLLSVNLFGDAMIDVWIECEKTRLSAEGPHLIGKVSRKQNFPGGALNVEANLESLGVHCVHTVTRVGEPQYWEPVKTRVLIDGQVMFRYDSNDEMKPVALEEALDGWNPKLPTVIVDYGEGSISYELARILVDNTQAPLFIHVKGDPRKYSVAAPNTPTVTPIFPKVFFCNEKEWVQERHGYDIELLGSCIDARVIVTKGRKGYEYNAFGQSAAIRGPSLADPNKIRHVCGAGDSFMAGFIAGWLRNDASVLRALDYASAAAASAIEQPYTAVADLNDVASHLFSIKEPTA